MCTVDGRGQRRSINPMYDRTFGVVGFGRIGRATVEKVRGMHMDVLAHDPYLDDDVFRRFDVRRVTFGKLLDQSDCISIHAPVTAETRYLFSTAEFEQRDKAAVILNTARSPIIDEQALVEAVERGEIFAAGLDVFETEPSTESPALNCDRIVCSPHHSGMSKRADSRYIQTGRAGIVRGPTDEHLQNVVNPDVFQRGDELATRKKDA